jgi:hypothetical protein
MPTDTDTEPRALLLHAMATVTLRPTATGMWTDLHGLHRGHKLQHRPVMMPVVRQRTRSSFSDDDVQCIAMQMGVGIATAVPRERLAHPWIEQPRGMSVDARDIETRTHTATLCTPHAARDRQRTRLPCRSLCRRWTSRVLHPPAAADAPPACSARQTRRDTAP